MHRATGIWRRVPARGELAFCQAVPRGRCTRTIGRFTADQPPPPRLLRCPAPFPLPPPLQATEEFRAFLQDCRLDADGAVVQLDTLRASLSEADRAVASGDFGDRTLEETLEFIEVGRARLAEYEDAEPHYLRSECRERSSTGIRFAAWYICFVRHHCDPHAAPCRVAVLDEMAHADGINVSNASGAMCTVNLDMKHLHDWGTVGKKLYMQVS